MWCGLQSVWVIRIKTFSVQLESSITYYNPGHMQQINSNIYLLILKLFKYHWHCTQISRINSELVLWCKLWNLNISKIQLFQVNGLRDISLKISLGNLLSIVTIYCPLNLNHCVYFLVTVLLGTGQVLDLGGNWRPKQKI